jgi:hypothetical protein
MTLFRDERGNLSAARILLTAWLSLAAGIVIFRPTAENAVLALLSGIALPLIAWAAGPRIAQYIGPQAGAVAAGVGASVRNAISKRRDTAHGVDPTP